MFATKIKMNSTANALGVFLHYPDGREPVVLADVSTGSTRSLANDIYVITATGTGNVGGTSVEFVIEGPVNSIIRKRTVRPDGTLRAWITFELDALGKVS